MDLLAAQLQAFAAGFPVAVLHALIAILVWIGAVALHAALHPAKPIDQVRHGNGAAAIALGGVMVCLALPIAAAMAASPSTLEGALWGLAISLVQLLALRLTDLVLRGLPDLVAEGDASAAALLTGARLAVAILLACSVLG